MEAFGIVGMTFGISGITFGIIGFIAFTRLEKLEKRLKDSGVLDKDYE